MTYNVFGGKLNLAQSNSTLMSKTLVLAVALLVTLDYL